MNILKYICFLDISGSINIVDIYIIIIYKYAV